MFVEIIQSIQVTFWSLLERNDDLFWPAIRGKCVPGLCRMTYLSDWNELSWRRCPGIFYTSLIFMFSWSMFSLSSFTNFRICSTDAHALYISEQSEVQFVKSRFQKYNCSKYCHYLGILKSWVIHQIIICNSQSS